MTDQASTAHNGVGGGASPVQVPGGGNPSHSGSASQAVPPGSAPASGDQPRSFDQAESGPTRPGYPQGYGQAGGPQGYAQTQGYGSHGGGPQGYAPAGYAPQGVTRAAGKPSPIGPILMLLGVVLAVVGIFLPWNHHMEVVDSASGGFSYEPGDAMNAFDQVEVNQDMGRAYGTLMLVAIILALLACLAVLISAVGSLVSRAPARGLRVLGLLGAIVGLLGTLGVLGGYLALGAVHEGEIGMWIYGLSFIPALVGAIILRASGRSRA